MNRPQSAQRETNWFLGCRMRPLFCHPAEEAARPAGETRLGQGDCHCPSNSTRANTQVGSDSHLTPCLQQPNYYEFLYNNLTRAPFAVYFGNIYYIFMVKQHLLRLCLPGAVLQSHLLHKPLGRASQTNRQGSYDCDHQARTDKAR